MKIIRMPSWAKYFILTYGITWLFWGIAVFLRLPISAIPIPILIVVGGIGLVASALILSYCIEKESYRVSCWQRFLDVRRMGWKWLPGSFLMPVVMTIAAGCLDQLLHGNGLSIPDRFSQNFFSLIPFAVFSLFFGPIPEEMGWRVSALGKLQ